MKQTYANYYKQYFSTPEGREAKRKAQNAYRKRLTEKYGMSYKKILDKRKKGEL